MLARAAAIMSDMARRLRVSDAVCAKSLTERLSSAATVMVQGAPKAGAGEAELASHMGAGAYTVRLWQPCSEHVGVLRTIADAVACEDSLGSCPEQQFQVCTVANAVEAVIGATQSEPGSVIDVAQRDVYSVSGVADQMQRR